MENYKTKICRIKKITIIKNADVYDITVAENHNFFANDILVHNCGEQGLEDKETCALGEFPLPNIESEHQLHRVLYYLYIIVKQSLLLKCHHKATEDVVHKNMRMGLGYTGDAMATKKQFSWLDKGYSYLRELDVAYSAKHGIPESIKLTTMKPGGTLSLLPGVTSGIADAVYPYFIRRITISANSELIKVAKEHGFDMEFKKQLDGSLDHNSYIVSFPAKYPHYARFVKDSSAVLQLERAAEVQKVWSDNAISCTVMYKIEELPEIKKWLLENYSTRIKGVSFLLHSGHGYEQAPFEEITRDEYNAMVARTTPILKVNLSEDDIDESQLGCAGGSCPIK